MVKKNSRFSPEVRERAVRLVFDAANEYGSQWAAIQSIASKIGCTPETLRRWARQAEKDSGAREGMTTDEKARIKQLEKENREFTAGRPNQLWVADFTYVATWKGFVYVAFVIDVFARMIVGWRVASSMKVDLTLDALEQALWARQVKQWLIHHSDRGSQYLAINYTERLADEGVARR